MTRRAINGVDRRRKLPVFATVVDGPAHLLLDPAMLYGVRGQREWALLEPLQDQGGPSSVPHCDTQDSVVIHSDSLIHDSESESV